jgi:hypothetical protein
MSKIEYIIYSVIVMICLTWAIIVIGDAYKPQQEPIQHSQVEQEELIEINKVSSTEQSN